MVNKQKPLSTCFCVDIRWVHPEAELPNIFNNIVHIKGLPNLFLDIFYHKLIRNSSMLARSSPAIVPSRCLIYVLIKSSSVFKSGSIFNRVNFWVDLKPSSTSLFVIVSLEKCCNTSYQFRCFFYLSFFAWVLLFFWVIFSVYIYVYIYLFMSV